MKTKERKNRPEVRLRQRVYCPVPCHLLHHRCHLYAGGCLVPHYAGSGCLFCSAYIPHDADKIPKLGADFHSRVSAQPSSDCQRPYSHCAGCFHSSRYRRCSDCETRQL